MYKSRPTVHATVVSLIVLLALAACSQEAATPAVASRNTPTLVLYSSLPDRTVAAITAAYTQSSGVPMHYMLGTESDLIEKLRTKAHRPHADLLLISGVGPLVSAAESDVLRPTTVEALKETIPATLRDPDNYWFGMSVRAVAVAYDRRSVEAAKLAGYASLGNTEWHGRLCLLSSENESSRTLVASLIAVLGKREAELVVRRWQKNLAAPVFSTARELLLAIEEGRCEAGLVGSDAVAEFFAEGHGDQFGLHWPSKGDGGTQLNVTGAGVTRHAENPYEAEMFVEWLASAEGQKILMSSGNDFAVNSKLPAPALLDNRAGFETSEISSTQLGYLIPEVILLNERADYR